MVTFISSVLGRFARYAARLNAVRNQILTERLLDSLPPELRKDIGWPDGYFDSGARVEWRANGNAARWPVKGEGTPRGRHGTAAEVLPLTASRPRHSVPVLPTRKAPVSS